MVGMKPSYRCRSEPQIAVLVIRMIASRGLRIFGSGTALDRHVFLAVPAESLSSVNSCEVDALSGSDYVRTGLAPRHGG